MHRLYTTSVASVFPHYVAKVERKGRTREELDAVVTWLTGLSPAQVQQHLDAGTTFEEFFDAVELNPDVSLITGSVCGGAFLPACAGRLFRRRRLASTCSTPATMRAVSPSATDLPYCFN